FRRVLFRSPGLGTGLRRLGGVCPTTVGRRDGLTTGHLAPGGRSGAAVVAVGRPALASGVAPSDAVAGLRGVPDGGCTGPVLFRGRPDPGGDRVAPRVPRTAPLVAVVAGGAPYS